MQFRHLPLISLLQNCLEEANSIKSSLARNLGSYITKKVNLKQKIISTDTFSLTSKGMAAMLCSPDFYLHKSAVTTDPNCEIPDTYSNLLKVLYLYKN
jgi:hypothetical protein